MFIIISYIYTDIQAFFQCFKNCVQVLNYYILPSFSTYHLMFMMNALKLNIINALNIWNRIQILNISEFSQDYFNIYFLFLCIIILLFILFSDPACRQYMYLIIIPFGLIKMNISDKCVSQIHREDIFSVDVVQLSIDINIKWMNVFIERNYNKKANFF